MVQLLLLYYQELDLNFTKDISKVTMKYKHAFIKIRTSWVEADLFHLRRQFLSPNPWLKFIIGNDS